MQDSNCVTFKTTVCPVLHYDYLQIVAINYYNIFCNHFAIIFQNSERAYLKNGRNKEPVVLNMMTLPYG